MFIHGVPARAQSASQINAIQSQIRSLNEQLAHLRRDMAAKDAAVRTAQADAARARATAEQTQTTVATLPKGLTPISQVAHGPTLGIYAAHPD